MLKLGITIPLVFVMLSLSACAAVQLPVNYSPPLTGQVYSLSPATVAYGIRAALSGAAGTSILSDGTRYLVVWCYQGEQAAGFYGIDTAGKVFDVAKALKDGGNFANSKTVSDLIASLKGAGWTSISPSAAPAILAEIAGSRLANIPVILLAVGVFDGGFENWFNDTFYAEEIKL